MRKSYKSGFTLIELAIVLTIVAILIAGVLQGDRLVSSFRVASTVSYFEKYKAAYDEFQKKYMALPGDLEDASNIISSAVTSSSGSLGDNKIDYSSNNTEQFAAWQQMAAAQLIQGGYSGTGTQTSYNTGSTNTNIPSGPHQQSGFRIYYDSTAETHFISYTRFQAGCNSANNCETVGVLQPSDSILVDKKMDDGIPNTGKILAVDGNSLSTSNVLSALNCENGSAYALTVVDKACLLKYSLDK
jgi:prepilin-type N-terminal cleavage/methylation domain-containing protein